MTDEQLMQIAIEESKRGSAPFGAVIAKDGEVIVKGHNVTAQDLDPTAHAEVHVIRQATRMLGTRSLHGYTLYTSSESCPMCASAEIWARLSRVVYGASIEQLIAAGLSQIAIPAAQVNMAGFVQYELVGGVLAEEALQVVKDWKRSLNNS